MRYIRGAPRCGRHAVDEEATQAPNDLAPTHLPLLTVLVLRFLACLPLHVATMVTATRAKGHDMVHDISRTPTLCFSRTWARMLFNERRTLRGVALIFGEARERGYEGEQNKRLE